ncbi:pseudouridine-5'-phosphate glycosidase, partial [Escherichia coli]
IVVCAREVVGDFQRGAEHSCDISADLQGLAHSNVTVVCAGAKSLLGLGFRTDYLYTFRFFFF